MPCCCQIVLQAAITPDSPGRATALRGEVLMMLPMLVIDPWAEAFLCGEDAMAGRAM